MALCLFSLKFLVSLGESNLINKLLEIVLTLLNISNAMILKKVMQCLKFRESYKNLFRPRQLSPKFISSPGSVTSWTSLIKPKDLLKYNLGQPKGRSTGKCFQPKLKRNRDWEDVKDSEINHAYEKPPKRLRVTSLMKEMNMFSEESVAGLPPNDSNIIPGCNQETIIISPERRHSNLLLNVLKNGQKTQSIIMDKQLLPQDVHPFHRHSGPSSLRDEHQILTNPKSLEKVLKFPLVNQPLPIMSVPTETGVLPLTCGKMPLSSLCLGGSWSSEDADITFPESFGMSTIASTPKSLTSIEHAGLKLKCEINAVPPTSTLNVHWQRELYEKIAKGPQFQRWMIWGDDGMALSGTVRFEMLLTLAKHPNPVFVKSPWADTHYGVYPTTLDIPSPSPSSDQEQNFLWDQIIKEESVGRYSHDFGPDLLLGMYSMPIHTVPKEGGKFRLVMNHSTGDFSLNSMIAKEDIARVTLDNVQDLGDALCLHHHQFNPNDTLHIWKADVSEAYQHMPMHLLWQIKQVVMFKGQRRIDHANVFGGHTSQCIFHAFMSLVMWLMVFVRLIQAFLYVNNSFSFARIKDMAFYGKYHKMLP
ncbi:hypothetical protein BDR06DRAFT_974262 [Suillus hirtellus]|nr:hypothetical protein BDR06DRAFT_974262 [Suillus hirtellus]